MAFTLVNSSDIDLKPSTSAKPSYALVKPSDISLQSVEEPTKDKSSRIADVARAAGSGLGEGSIGLVTGPIDLGARGSVYLGNKIGKAVKGDQWEKVPYMPSLTEALTKAAHLDYAPTTTLGDYFQTIGSFVPAVAAATEGNELPMAKLAANIAKKSAIAGGTSETAGQLTKGTAAEPWARLAGGVASDLIPTGLAATAKTLGRGGATPETITKNMDVFKDANTTPTVGQATQSRPIRAAESFLSKIPGSAGMFVKKAEQQGESIGKKVDKMASELASSSSAEQAGRAIEKGINEGFMPLVRSTQIKLYNTLDNFIPADTRLTPSNTLKTLHKMTKLTEGAEETSGKLVNPELQKLQKGLEADMQKNASYNWVNGQIENATIPYSALKDLRSRIGAKLDTTDLTSTIPKAELKRLYAGLSEDMRAAAKAAGPSAETAFNRANRYTTAFHDRVDKLQSVIDRHHPEKIFQAAVSGTAEGATQLRSVMRSLPDEGKKLVSATVLRRLGRATPSNQNDVGSIFSTNTFLTNWNKLSPEAKETLFRGYGSGFSKDMDSIAKVAENLKKGSEVFKNGSGTAQAETLIKAGNSLATALVALLGVGVSPVAGAKVLGGIISANAASRLMTNPKFVKWLAGTTRMPASSSGEALASLNAALRATNNAPQN